MLLAPDKGSEIRRNISRTTGDWASNLGDIFANAKGELTKAATKGKIAGRRAVNRAEDYI
jgi:hypothetical protein